MGIVATNSSEKLIEAIEELSTFREQSVVATAFNVGNSFYLVNEEWRRADPKTPAEILAHYRECKWQVEQQVFATYGIEHEMELRDRVIDKVADARSVLDLGAGIGATLLEIYRHCPKIEKMVHADVGGVMMGYAKWRYANARLRYGRQAPRVDFVELGDDYLERKPFGGQHFDAVICTEVIEHVPDPVRLVGLLAGLVEPGGLLVATTSFDDGDGMVPMHLNVGKYTDEEFAKVVFPMAGFEEESEGFYRKL